MKRLVFGAIAIVAMPAFAGSVIVAKHAALATASPYATQVGLDVLRRGGNAIDAAVAVAFTLAVVHPQAGNIGGGGFLVYYEAATHAVWTLDFREVAPAAAKNRKPSRDGAANTLGTSWGPTVSDGRGAQRRHTPARPLALSDPYAKCGPIRPPRRGERDLGRPNA